jgi:hypothetical protein
MSVVEKLPMTVEQMSTLLKTIDESDAFELHMKMFDMGWDKCPICEKDTLMVRH